MSEKTEEPTPRQLRRARQKGDVAVSAALSQAVGLLAALAVAESVVLATFRASAQALSSAVDGRALTAPELAACVVALSLPVIATAGFASGALSFVQSGGLFAPSRLAPDLSRLDPIAGLGNLFSVERLFTLARALVAATLVGAFAYSVLRDVLPALAATPGELRPALAVAGDTAGRLARYAGLVGLGLGLIDLGVLRRAHRRRWRMSRDEVRRDFREDEGDPEIKAARRRAHQEVLISAQIRAVEKARVVVVNPTHLAVALGYDETVDAAPKVLAQGQGEIARRIVDAARAYGVPIVRDVPVARALNELEVGDEIPEALYAAVAEILREVWDAESSATP
ncbi:MAG TPA: EscU/YscU/HrcU family type III secretion system export apparatus switch protein [Polyangiaceae bacterium]|nr:EscU/YscU/HrcU family type III secretion system export apparatus switch protein [Polyangiaceae bacterium]